MIERMSSTAAPAPVNLIVGADEFLAERRRQVIVEATRKHAGNDDLPVEIRKASELSAPEIIELLSPSLFAEDRIIVVWGIEDVAKEIVDALEASIKDPAPGVVLILLHTGKGRNKKLVQSWPKLGAVVTSAEELRGRELASFVDQEFQDRRVRVTPEVSNLLVEAVGTNLRELSSAVSQLVADTEGEITVATVRDYYTGVAEVAGFDIADQAVLGRVDRALASTRRALQLGTSPVAIASALARKVGDIAMLYDVRGNPNQLAGELGMHPFVAKKTMQVARQWTASAVTEAVIIVADLDAEVKGQGGDQEFAVEDAVRRIAELV